MDTAWILSKLEDKKKEVLEKVDLARRLNQKYVEFFYLGSATAFQDAINIITEHNEMYNLLLIKQLKEAIKTSTE